MKKYLFIISILICSCQALSASYGLYNLEKLNNMLSNNAILCMHQDALGFMWFGTYDGLNLFDGKKVTTFRYELNNPNSLSGNNIHNIQSIGSDYLWVATQVGLNKFSIKERKVVESYPKYKKIELITTDNISRNTWIISKDNCIEYYDSLKRTFHGIPFNVKIRDIRSFFVDTEGRLCVVKSDGNLQFLTLEEKKGKEANRSLSVKNRKIHDRKISQVFYEDGYIYFIDEENNLFFYDSIKQQKIWLRNILDLVQKYGIISSLVFFQDDVFIAFMRSGLIKLNMSNHDKPEPINMTIGVFGLQKDRFQNAIWVGTDGRGVELYYSEKDKFSNILFENLPFTARRPIRSFYTDEENTLWIGTKGDGIIRIKDYDKFSNVKIPSSNIQRIVSQSGYYESPVYYFLRSKYNNGNDLWIASDDGILYYSYKGKNINKLESNDANCVIDKPHIFCEINDSVLWVSAAGGLYKVVVDKKKHPYRIISRQIFPFKKDGIVINDEYYSMIYDGTSKIFLGSRRGYGIIRLDIHTGKYDFISMDDAQNKGLGDVISLHLDKDSTLYIGAGSGLTQIKMRDKMKNEIKQFSRHNGIINDMIHGILKDDNGIIWLSTNKGLVKYNPLNDSFFNVKSPQIDVAEYSDDAYWYCPITHRLFFGGVNGLVWIEPKNGEGDSYYKPDLLFTELNYFGNEKTLYEYNQDSSKVLELEDNQNTFQISFAVLDFIHGDNYDFSYILENYDSDWNSLQKESKIYFTKLPPGNYTLKVRYKSDVLYANDNIYTLRIRVLPPWYLSVVAYIVYGILFLMLMFLLFCYIRKKVKKKQELLAKRIKEEHKEKAYESKLRFFTNVTHEFYTPLTLINGAVEQIKKEGEGNERIDKYIKILHNNTLNLNELVQEVLDYRKVEESENVPQDLKYVSISKLLRNLLNSFAEIAAHNDIKLSADVQEDLNWYTDSASLKKIISNLISNAFKYTPVGGEVKVSVGTHEGELKIVVYNTGRGIEPDKIKKIFNRYRILEDTNVNANNQMTARHGLGLYICHSMTKLLQGDIKVESEVGSYTQFTVTLPDLMSEKREDTIMVRPDVDAVKIADNKQEVEARDEKMINIESFESTPNLVLVIDDNPEIVELVSDILSRDYSVRGVYSASEAFAFLKTQTPSLIITDIMMPEIDGLSFIKTVREDKYNKHIPIIALSAKIEDQDQIRGYEFGADAYITKPFSAEVLLSIVNRFLINRENIKEYYDTVESAFEYNQGKLMHQKDREFIETLTEILNENISNTKLGPDFVSEKMKISSRNLYRQVKKILSVSPTDYIKDYKLFYASRLLISTNLSIKEIIYKVGISNKSYFYREFAKKYNMSPKQYKDSTKNQGDNPAGT